MKGSMVGILNLQIAKNVLEFIAVQKGMYKAFRGNSGPLRLIASMQSMVTTRGNSLLFRAWR